MPFFSRKSSFLTCMAFGLASLLGGCEGDGPQTAQRAAPLPAPAAETQLVVFAAASLREAFTTLGDAFEAAHPGVKITFNFAGSQELRTQLELGASADVLASADQRHMAELLRAARVQAPSIFARNEPVIVVARESATRIRTLADLPSARRVVLGGPEVPIGRYSLQVLDNASRTLGSDFRARVEAHVISHELNVKQVLAHVVMGEADVGIVYRSDAQASKEPVAVVTIPAELNVIAEYPIAVVRQAAHPQLAQAWLALVLSETGQRVLHAHGFIAPTQLAAAATPH